MTNAATAIHEQLGVTTIITLKHPVTLGDGTRVESLKVRRLNIGDVRSASNISNDIQRELHILARVTGLVPEDLDLISFADYQQLQDLFREQSNED